MSVRIARRMMGMAGAALLMLGAAMADEVTDAIQEGLDSYKAGKFSDAANSLNYAVQLLAQKKGGALETCLPKALEGWTAEDAESQAAGAQMFGGGVTAERRYSKDPANITIKIVTDSPLLQGMMMMFSNPMLATSDGGKMEKIGGEKAIVKYKPANKDGSINVVVAGKYMVTVEGSDVSLADLKAYATAIDFKKMAALP